MKQSVFFFLVLVLLVACASPSSSPSSPSDNQPPLPAPATNEIFTPRFAHQTLSFDDKIWVIGGVIVKDATGVNLNDVWFSDDGRAWQQATSDASWKPRTAFGTVVFNDKMWLLGGVTSDGDDYTFLNDVWDSTNGRDWNLVTSDTPWEYAGSNPFVFKSKMWIIGLGNIDGDIFSSGNGKDWYLEGRSNKSFEGGSEAVVFEKKFGFSNKITQMKVVIF